MRPNLGFVVVAVLLSIVPAPGQEVSTEAKPASLDPPVGRLAEQIECASDPTQTYTLYLPSHFNRDQRWPVLLVFDPRGRSVVAAEVFQGAAERYGWMLLSSDNTRSDGPWEPNLRALRALLPELAQRWPADPFRLYATGFSGGAMVAQLLARETKSLAGVIGVGGRFLRELLPEEGYDYAHFGAAGSHDFNYWEMRALDEELDSRQSPHRLEIFEGRHQWFAPDLALRAVEWMEIQAMKEARRGVDRDLAVRLLAQDLARAQQLEEAGDPLTALRHYRAVNRTFTGFGFLEDRLGAVRESIGRLEADRDVVRAHTDEKHWQRYEAAAALRLGEVMAKLRDPEQAVQPRRMAVELRLDHLKKQAEKASFEGHTAQRILEKVFSQLSFYLTRDLFQAKSYRQAVVVLTLATQIHDDRPWVWYNLACALAQSGSRKRAVEALERAVELGYADLEHLRGDPDLEPLRQAVGYREIVGRLGG